MTTSNLLSSTGTAFQMSPLDYANVLNKTYTDATDLYNRAVGMFGETSAQAASAKNNMLASQRQLSNLSGAATGALPATGAVTTTPATGALTTTPATGALPTATSGLSTATGASPSTAGDVTAAPATSATTAAPTATSNLDIGAMLSANALGDNNLTPDQLLTLLRFNNLTIDQAAPFLGDATTRAGLVSGLKDYKKSYDARYVDTYDPKTINTYALYQAEEAARDGRHVDFSNQNRATQIEAMRRGYWTPADLRPSGTGSTYGSQNIYLTSGLTNANQGITGNPLVSTLQTALQNPGGMRENIEKAVRAYEDQSGNVTATPAQIAAADAYVKRLTGNPNATYAQTLRNLDTYGGGGFMYDEQRLLGDVKSNLTKGLEANLSISKWDPKTRGEMFAQQINKLKVTPSFVAAALGVSENDILRLAGGDPALWSRLAVNELIPTQPVREGASYRYGPAATVSGSNANTALTASQPTTSRSNTAITSSQPTDTGKILPRVDLFPQTGAGLVNPQSVRVGTKVVYMESISGLPIPEQVRKLTELGVKASNLIASGFNTNYVNDLVSQGLPR